VKTGGSRVLSPAAARKATVFSFAFAAKPQTQTKSARFRLDAGRIPGLFACGSMEEIFLSIAFAASPRKQWKKKTFSMLPQAKGDRTCNFCRSGRLRPA
jgi:hypothetical protein